MSNFPERFGYERATPPRTILGTDSDELRGALWRLVTNGGGDPKHGYQLMREVRGLMPDPNVWSADSSREELARLINDLTWLDVYEALEEIHSLAGKRLRFSKGDVQNQVNQALERSGLAYEMVRGKFQLVDRESDLLRIRDTEGKALDDLTGSFEPVRVQYGKALEKLHALQPDDEGAVADAVNALEAVAKIVTGSSSGTLSNAVRQLFPEGGDGHMPLKVAIEKIYAFANNTPGIRHGRYAEPQLLHAEALLVVRLAGSILSFLIFDHSSRRAASDSGPTFTW